MRTALALCVAALIPSVAAGQVPAATGSISGTVFDSVARVSLSGAHVQVITNPPSAEMYHSQTDSRGRYTVSGIPPGRYIIGFLHVGLDSLSLESPLRAVEVKSGERATVHLAVPSPSRIVTSVCRSNAADSTGLLLGQLFAERPGAPADSGTVIARWHEIIIDSSGANSHDRATATMVGPDGWFMLCGVPAGTDIVAYATRGADSSGMRFVAVPQSGLVRYDFTVGGRVRVRGIVLSEKSRPVENARVSFAGSEGVSMTDSAGSFHLDRVHAGTQTIEVRALGYSPELLPVMLNGGDTTLIVKITSIARVMDTIRVLGQRRYNRDTHGFERRRRMGFGKFFDEATVRQQRPHSIYQLLYSVPSVVLRYGVGRPTLLMRGGTGGASYCEPQVFVNGMRMPSDINGDLDLLVRPEELAGMEVYRTSSVPAEFRSYSGCGSIVIWTGVPVRTAR